MKKTVITILTIGLFSVEMMYAHGNEKHSETSQMMIQGSGSMPGKLSGKNMTPKMKKMQMQKMQDSVIAIMQKEIKYDLGKALSMKAEANIRTQLQTLMRNMQKKMMPGNLQLEKPKRKI